MAQDNGADKVVVKGIPIFKLWQKYEDIAMHFNDLLIRLRIQALAGVAALATVVSIFTKVETPNIQGSWEVAAGVFGALCLIWGAIWMLDLLYYNRLLIGAVAALVELEKASKEKSEVHEIQMSTRIEGAIGNTLPNPRSTGTRLYLLRGVWAFYTVVFLTLFIAFGISLDKAVPSGSWVSARCAPPCSSQAETELPHLGN